MADQNARDTRALSVREIGDYAIYADWELVGSGQCAPVLTIRKRSAKGEPPVVAFGPKRLAGEHPTATLARAHAMQYGIVLVNENSPLLSA